VNTAVAPLWQALVDHGVDVALVGHDHAYERFAPIDASGAADPERGIRELVVGTGGKSLARRRWNAPNSEVRRSATAGILQVTLRADEYSWRFVTAPRGRVGDSGTSDCV
jgi:acid phosphatase type 7